MRTTFTLLLLLIAAAPVLADPPDEDVLRPYLEGKSGVFVQADLGLNLNFLNGNPFVRPLILSYEQETSLYRSAFGLGPLLGLSVGYEFSSHFGVTLRADYDVRSASRSESLNDTCVQRDQASNNVLKTPMGVTKDYEVTVNYLSISLLPTYRFNYLFLFAGPTLSIPLARTVRESDRITQETPCFYLAPGPDTTKAVSGELTDNANSNTRFSVKVGAGYIVRASERIDLIPQVALDLGLNDTFKSDETLQMRKAGETTGESLDVPINRHIRINTLQISLGVRVYL
jgi:Outer membrane protein beta-barrel domain